MSPKKGLIRAHHSTLVLFQRLFDISWIGVMHWLPYHYYEAAGFWRVEDSMATVFAMLIFLFVAEAMGLYNAWRGVPFRYELLRVWGAWGAVAGALLLVAFAVKQSDEYSRVTTLGWFVGTPVAIAVWRGFVRRVLHELRQRGRNTRQVAVIGLTELAERVARKILSSPWLGMNIVGFFEDREPERCHPMPEDVGALVGTFAECVERAKAGEIDLIYMALPLKAEPRVQSLLRDLADTTASVYVVPDFFVFDLLHGRWSSLGEIPVVSVFETPFSGVDAVLKRIEDIILGSIFLSIAGLPMIAVALAVKLTSKGPVFFKQRRYGLNGEVIHVLKFRSMRVQEDGAKVTQATKNDSRITPVGRFIRRTSLDELPQLIHVVTGSMSLVGPRPHAVAHNEEYRKRIHGYMLRHKVKPGLTGWAQVNGWRGETDTLHKMEMRIQHDLEYIRRWSLFFDIKIVFLTVFGSKVRSNAY